jgi:hypothetical protein
VQPAMGPRGRVRRHPSTITTGCQLVKVYGMTAMRSGGQARVIGAFPSVAAFLRASGDSRATWNWYGSPTSNEAECNLALGSPGTVFYRGINDRGTDPWTEQARGNADV